jgi:hypothetical protein
MFLAWKGQVRAVAPVIDEPKQLRTKSAEWPADYYWIKVGAFARVAANQEWPGHVGWRQVDRLGTYANHDYSELQMQLVEAGRRYRASAVGSATLTRILANDAARLKRRERVAAAVEREDVAAAQREQRRKARKFRRDTRNVAWRKPAEPQREPSKEDRDRYF